MKKAFVAILSFVALVACSQDTVVKTSDHAAITFENFVEKKTRAAVDPSTTTESIDEFSVWGFRGDAAALILQEERVYKSGEGWIYDNLQYWNEGADYFFAAVSPVKHEQVEVDASGLCKTGLGSITFTNTSAGDVDLIYASQLIDKSNVDAANPQPVQLKFAHLLSKVKFSMAYDFPNDLTTVAVKDIKLANTPAEGTIDLTKERTNWMWTLPQTGETVTMEFGDIEKGAQFPAVNEYYESDVECLLIPADATRSYTITFTIEVYNNGVLSAEYPKTVTLTNRAFVQGKNYNLKTVITPDNIVEGGLQPIEFEVIEVEAWDDPYTDVDLDGEQTEEPVDPDQPVDPENPEQPFVAVASEWGVVGDLTSWADAKDIVMYTTPTEKLFVAEKVEIKNGSFKIRANGKWDDAKNYGFQTAGKAYADKYYAVITGGGSQNITPIEYGVYDVYFDLAQKRVALMTPGKAYAEAEDGGAPVVVVEGLKDHAWGLIGSFAGSNWSTDVVMTIDGNWAVAKNVTIAKNNEFKFRADKAWTLSYGSACDVVADKTYTTYNNGGNMKFIGETGAYDIYFSMVDAKFYMTAAGAEAPAEPEVLATPVVEASVEGNVVTLTWATVENAAQYGITVGTEMPVFVEETTYVFTGEYETEYTFNVVAVPADEEAFAASEAAAVTATTEAEPQPETPAAGSQVTVAKFLEMADTATEFVLTGKVARVVNTQYGNFDLTDETGTIYIYGLCSPTGAQQYWAESGVREGDTITVKGKYSVYNNSPQVKNAVYVSHVPAPFVFAEAAAIEADVVEVSISVESNVAWTVSCDAAWVKSYSQSGTNNSDIDIEVEANTTSENRVATFTISGEGVADYTVTLTQYAAGASDTKGTYTSEAFFKGGTDGGKSYQEKVTVSGTQYDCLKLGTSSVIGKYTTKAVGEAGDLTLSFYAVGWNGKTSKLNVYVDGVKVGETITLKSNSGAANNAPYTITPSDSTDYYSISVPGITETSKITFETVSGATRAIIFGVQLY